jgi:glycolate oxidase
MSKSLADQLRKLIGNDAVADDPATLAVHSGDKWFAAHEPEVVVFAGSTTDVSKLLQFASREKIPVTARGAGFGYVGGCVPARGGIALSFARMNRIKEISFGDAVAIVEPGVITADLKAAARAQNLFYPPDPASMKDCTIGGNIATNAGGPRCLKYGVTRNYVIALEVVLANGDPLKTGGRVHKNKTGFDLIGLFVGWKESRCGDESHALAPLPPARATLSAAFATAASCRSRAGDFAAGFCYQPNFRPFHVGSGAARSRKLIVPPGTHLLVDLDGRMRACAARRGNPRIMKSLNAIGWRPGSS